MHMLFLTMILFLLIHGDFESMMYCKEKRLNSAQSIQNPVGSGSD